MNPYPIASVRSAFPALSGAQPTPVYLDNPAGTLVPRMVVSAVADAMETASSNLGAYFDASRRADEIWTEAHRAAADLMGAASEREIIIGPNMTTLTMHLSRSIGRALSPGDEIIVTRMDHEGDISPWLLLAEDLGLVVKWLPFNTETWRIEPEDLIPLLTPRTRLLAINHASNMTGSINDIKTLSALAKDAGAWVYVDGVQFVPHLLPDVQALGCDFYACSSYKFFGPHLGIVWGREELLSALEPYKCRCTSDELPVRFETGTPQTELLAGLTATIDYLATLGDDVDQLEARRARLAKGYGRFADHEMGLSRKLIAGLEQLPGITVHGIRNPNRFSWRVPTISFTHAQVSTHQIARTLAQQRINVWSGHNYALEPARHLGLDEDEGVVRIGIAHYNTEEEIDRTLNAIKTAVC